MRRLIPAALLITIAAVLVPSTAWAGPGRTVITTCAQWLDPVPEDPTHR